MRKLRPLKAIRAKCLDCSESPQDLKECPITDCALYEFRSGKKPSKSKLTPLKAIKKKCLDCCCGSRQEVKLCPVSDCSLYGYRVGKNPHRKGIGGEGFLAKGKVGSTTTSKPGKLSKTSAQLRCL